MNYPFQLQKYNGQSTRHNCPGCGDAKSFSLYVDNSTGEPIAPTVGKCNHVGSCGYHLTPKEYFEKAGIDYKPVSPTAREPEPEKPITYIAPDLIKGSLKNYDQNNFVIWLTSLFDTQTVQSLISSYLIGTSNHWPGATVFYQIDMEGKIRTGKIMLYNPITGKRIKEPFSHINWLHSVLKLSDFNLKQCFFGEHLLVDKTKPIAIVESEKTAIVASVYLPEYIWIATGGMDNLSMEKSFPLVGRDVILFPDGNGFEKWNSKTKELKNICNVAVSDVLNNLPPENKGFDIADFLIQQKPPDRIKTSHQNKQPDRQAEQQAINEKLWEKYRWGWEPESRTDLYKGFDSYFEKKAG